MIFNAEMVRAILDGRKTQTRRLVNPEPDAPQLLEARTAESGCVYAIHANRSNVHQGRFRWDCPFGQPGDRIWVRETFASGLSTKSTLAYRATHKREYLEDGFYDTIKWTPSIHMPRWASRITLEITGVRVERLASISSDDARAEGYPASRAADGGNIDPWLWFRDLWDGIYAEQAFKHNPWVWVIEFKRIAGGAA
jgi:hypothetical protein